MPADREHSFHAPLLRDDEQIEPATAVEAFLLRRLSEARATIATATITCDSDLSRNCDEEAECLGCGKAVWITMQEAVDV